MRSSRASSKTSSRSATRRRSGGPHRRGRAAAAAAAARRRRRPRRRRRWEGVAPPPTRRRRSRRRRCPEGPAARDPPPPPPPPPGGARAPPPPPPPPPPVTCTAPAAAPKKEVKSAADAMKMAIRRRGNAKLVDRGCSAGDDRPAALDSPLPDVPTSLSVLKEVEEAADALDRRSPARSGASALPSEKGRRHALRRWRARARVGGARTRDRAVLGGDLALQPSTGARRRSARSSPASAPRMGCALAARSRR